MKLIKFLLSRNKQKEISLFDGSHKPNQELVKHLERDIKGLEWDIEYHKNKFHYNTQKLELTKQALDELLKGN